MRLASKIFLGFSLVIVVVAAAGVISLRAVGRLVSVNREIAVESVPALRLSTGVRDTMLSLARLQARYVVLTDRRYAELWRESADRARVDLDRLQGLVPRRARRRTWPRPPRPSSAIARRWSRSMRGCGATGTRWWTRSGGGWPSRWRCIWSDCRRRRTRAWCARRPRWPGWSNARGPGWALRWPPRWRWRWRPPRSSRSGSRARCGACRKRPPPSRPARSASRFPSAVGTSSACWPAPSMPWPRGYVSWMK